MRKSFILFFIIVLLLPACSSTQTVDTVFPLPLTKDQQEIIDLIATDKQVVSLFGFDIHQSYSSVEFWVDVYEKDSITPTGSGIFSLPRGDGDLSSDKLSILINENKELSWSITYESDGSKSSFSTEPIAVPEYTAKAFAPINEAVEIQRGKEIILYYCIYADGTIRSYNHQELSDPALLRQYDFAYVFKCKFD